MDTPVHSAVILAMERELGPFLRRCQRVSVDGIRCCEREGTVYACGGIGRGAATRTAGAVLERYRPGLVISAGFAGALDGGLRVGQILNPELVINTQNGQRYRTAPAEGEADRATLVTVDGTVDAADKRGLAAQFGAQLVDMEAAAVAEVACRAGVDFMAIKAISDDVDFAMPPVGRYVSSTGEFQDAQFAAWAAWHPGQWAAVWRLGRNTRAAARNLCDHFERYTPEWQRYVDRKGAQARVRPVS